MIITSASNPIDFGFQFFPPYSLESVEILKLIGRGAFASVHLVKDVKSNELLTLKSISKEFLKSIGKLHYSEKERMILEYVKDPKVVELRAFFEDEFKVYFLMEYLPFGDLLNYCEERGRLIRGKFFTKRIKIHNLSIVATDRVLSFEGNNPQRPQTRKHHDRQRYESQTDRFRDRRMFFDQRSQR